MKFIVTIPLLFLLVQDFRRNEVAIWKLGLLLVCSLCSGCYNATIIEYIEQITVGLLLVFFIIAFLFVYYKIKTPDVVMADTLIGKGDLVFIVIMPFFLVAREILIVLVFASLIGLVYRFLVVQKKEIPFIGMMGLVCIPTVLMN